MTSARPEYRPSASLIIAAKTEETAAFANVTYDYKLLLFKRTLPTAYMPEHCVFPGGTFEEDADEALEWLQYFHECGITDAKLAALTPRGNRPKPLLTSGRNFARDISLRITALRETFEEVGVLLCCNYNGQSFCHEQFDRHYWQQLVHNDATQFLKLCRTLQVLPDLWILQEWSCWRSPATATKKFDTIYYFVALERMPSLLLEPSEVEIELWDTPTQFLRDFTECNIWLPPIQYYEICRLTHAHNWQDLNAFARQRNDKGSTLLWLVYYRAEHILIGTLPGDDDYPTEPEKLKLTVEVPMTFEEFQQKSKKRHRVIVKDVFDMVVDSNILPLDEHYNPVMKPMLLSKI